MNNNFLSEQEEQHQSDSQGFSQNFCIISRVSVISVISVVSIYSSVVSVISVVSIGSVIYLLVGLASEIVFHVKSEVANGALSFLRVLRSEASVDFESLSAHTSSIGVHFVSWKTEVTEVVLSLNLVFAIGIFVNQKAFFSGHRQSISLGALDAQLPISVGLAVGGLLVGI